MVPFHNWLMLWPLGQVQLAVQPPYVPGLPWFMMVTSPWKPPFQVLVTL